MARAVHVDLPLSGKIASPVAEAGSGMNDPVPVFCRPHHAARVGHVAEHALHVESVKRFGRSGCPAEYANRMTIFDHAAAKMRAEKTAPSRDQDPHRYTPLPRTLLRPA